MNEYEDLFNRFANPFRNMNFTERKNGKSLYAALASLSQIKYQTTVYCHKKTDKILTYSIQMTNQANEPFIGINYMADAPKFVPESVRYFEPTWQDFTDKELAKAIEYLSPYLQLRMKKNRDHYAMLVFKDHFYLAIRIKNEHNDLEHSLCIKAHNINIQGD